ncbi:LuxR C-terminal-related transcriptional regulator [Stigmatella sp. ncwal1]|uniref:LuxR C-terminal-related transcriptional regulator n=1 Tax=Stigmatella ashevillensis TaxID=2995309 RepID=A0ABT5DKB3_9BACT|nr:LuxR C-terminal-related transcriptional regulator [Stigmatella ashevillena]MDC0712787.1 LuxR C-terminal-related transcriptional regulator [Stigmatella ashevillena]
MESRDRTFLADLQRQIDTVEAGAEVLHSLTDTLREGLRAERAMAYGVTMGVDHYGVGFCHAAGFSAGTALYDTLDTFLRQRPSPWGYFDPARPASAQRNRVLHFRPPTQVESQEAPLHEAGAASWKRLGIGPEQEALVRERVSQSGVPLYHQLGVENMFQLRALICEGPALLSWIGALRSKPFTPREQRLFQTLVPMLQRRLTLEARLRETGLLHSALEAALEALGQPAFVLTSAHQVVHANRAGRALAEQSTQPLVEAVQRHLRGEPAPPEISVTALRVPGLAMHYLVVDKSARSQASARVHLLAERWELTTREEQVLEHIVQGQSNRAIAAQLGCSERTVEVHVTHVLSKAWVESRSALIAKFFQSP